MKALGLNYPIEHGQQGYFNQTFDTLSNEKIKLKNLIYTIEGERYMQPTLGLGLHKYLFENMTADTSYLIESEIKRKVSFWLPNLVINDMLVDVVENTNTINITLSFSLKTDLNNYDILNFTL